MCSHPSTLCISTSSTTPLPSTLSLHDALPISWSPLPSALITRCDEEAGYGTAARFTAPPAALRRAHRRPLLAGVRTRRFTLRARARTTDGPTRDLRLIREWHDRSRPRLSDRRRLAVAAGSRRPRSCCHAPPAARLHRTDGRGRAGEPRRRAIGRRVGGLAVSGG